MKIGGLAHVSLWSPSQWALNSERESVGAEGIKALVKTKGRTFVRENSAVLAHIRSLVVTLYARLRSTTPTNEIARVRAKG